MRHKLITMTKDGKKVEVAESSYEAVWKRKGWSKASDTAPSEESSPESTAPEGTPETDRPS